MRELPTLAPITYNDTDAGLRLTCYSDTLVYHSSGKAPGVYGTSTSTSRILKCISSTSTA